MNSLAKAVGRIDYLSPSNLNVIGVISNPREFTSRYKLFAEWQERMQVAGVNLIIVESQFGPDRPFMCTDPDNPNHVQVRNTTELWLKESLINAGINRLTENLPTWTKAMTCDADIAFMNPYWVTDVIEELDRYDFLQPWTNAVDLGPGNEFLKKHTSFFKKYLDGAAMGKGYEDWHPGYSLAFTRRAIEAIGGFPELCILGAGDRTLCCALIGQVQVANPQNVSASYAHYLDTFQARALELKLNVGYVDGTIMHYWHGKKANRGYVTRWQVLVKNAYNPYEDVKKNAFGVIELAGNKPMLRNGIRQYLSSRNEDSIDLE